MNQIDKNLEEIQKFREDCFFKKNKKQPKYISKK